jgi:hypothetical protein
LVFPKKCCNQKGERSGESKEQTTSVNHTLFLKSFYFISKKKINMENEIRIEPYEGGKWCIREANHSFTNLVFDTRADAVREGHRMAMENKGLLLLHDEKGFLVDQKDFSDSPDPDRNETF